MTDPMYCHYVDATFSVYTDYDVDEHGALPAEAALDVRNAIKERMAALLELNDAELVGSLVIYESDDNGL